MRTAFNMSLLFAVLLMMATGCAKDNLVKKDDPVAKGAVSATSPAAGSAENAVSPTASTVKSNNSGSSATSPSGSTAKPEGTSGAAGKADSAASATATSASAAGSKKDAASAGVSIPESIYFDFDSYLLSTGSRSSLTAVAEYLKKTASAKLNIEGNCDERGSDEYNLALGDKRAKSAAAYLKTLGVDESRLSTISYGKEKPKALGHDEESWSKNRRDDFVIQK